MKTMIPCSACEVKLAQKMHRCENMSIYRNEMCNCCEDCAEACWQEYVEMIDSGEADQEVIDYYKGDD